MFTGIVEELGIINKIEKGPDSARLEIGCQLILEGIKVGDSIAVNGICLTVISFDQGKFAVDVMFETLQKTNLQNLKVGEKVNLERALSLNDRLGGHLVSGHIDGVGKILRQEVRDIAVLTNISADQEIIKYAVPKGSIAVDGISLTIVKVEKDNFSVSLIPHTAKMTTLGFKKAGDQVNLEVDLIARYINRLVHFEKQENKSDLSYDFLVKHGFA